MTNKPVNTSRKEERAKAEATAIDYIKQKHNGTAQIFVRTVYHEGTVWVILGEVSFKKAYFFTVEKSFSVKINPETGTVESYAENGFSSQKSEINSQPENLQNRLTKYFDSDGFMVLGYCLRLTNQ